MKILFLSDIVLEPIAKLLQQEGKHQIEIAFHEDLLGGLHSAEPSKLQEFDLVLIHTDVRFKKHSSEKIAGLLNQIEHLCKSTSVNILCSDLLELPFPKGILSKGINSIQDAWQFIHQEVNNLNGLPNFYWLNIDEQFRLIGYSNIYSYSLGHLYQMPYNKRAIGAFTTLINHWLEFLYQPEKKVIVLDCDNTLWNGIIGEDGLSGIRCDLSHEGIQFYHLQQFLLERKSMGFLLCLCSKNNENDVKEAFDSLNMPLKWDDFILKKVNWEDKSMNMRSMAAALNVGTDSFIFLDDSDFEVQSVRSLLPEVSVFQVKKDYSDFLITIDSFLFKRKQLSSEDLRKHEQYIEEATRKQDEAAFGSMEDYIKSLSIKLDIRCNDSADFERVSQLTQKTNQFNFNKVAYSPAEILELSSSENRVYTLRVSDKYGDYGLVGVILFKKNVESYTLHNFLMSCRALGRRIEYDFLNYVYSEIQQQGISINQFEFVKTDRNKPAEDFYLQLSKDPIWQ
jgi:FkbH-like protein